jgi:hypothetical protein
LEFLVVVVTKKCVVIAEYLMLGMWFATLLVWWLVRKSGFIPQACWVDTFRCLITLAGAWVDIILVLIGIVLTFIRIDVKHKIWYWVILFLVVSLSVFLGDSLMEA